MIDPTKRSHNPAKRAQLFMRGLEASASEAFQEGLDRTGYNQAKAIKSVENWGKENGLTRGTNESIREFIVRLTGLPLEQIEREIPLLLARCDGLRG